MIVRVGVIDSGLSAGNWPIVEAKDFTGAANVSDALGHGTAVTQRLLSSGVTIELYIARVFDRQLNCSTESCVAALGWLLELAPHLVNMSFGLRRNDDDLRALCRNATQAGIAIVAASPAQGDPVYPSAYQGVVRGTGDARCAAGEISFLDSPQADFGGYVGNPAAGPAGASIGCASVSARLVALRYQQPNVATSSLIEQLAESADYQGVEVRSPNV